MRAYRDWEITALRVREHILRMAGRGGCFVGASLSAVEIVTALYQTFLRDTDPDNPDRDRFFLSKGHDVPALYGLFAELGYLDAKRLELHLSFRDHLYWHPSRRLPRVEFHSGSLGHLLSVAVGQALHARMKGLDYRVAVLLGDGELDEGSNWEALLVASAYRLDNLLLVVDRNGYQANFPTEELIPLEPLEDKFAAFGAEPVTVDGHCFASLDEVFDRFPRRAGKPTAVIARTLRGKGVPSLEGRADRWFCSLTSREVDSLVKELHGGRPAGELNRDNEVVR